MGDRSPKSKKKNQGQKRDQNAAKKNEKQRINASKQSAAISPSAKKK
jgi:hypothetical protein